MQIYLDGSWVDKSQATFGLDLFSLSYAVCCFEGIRSYVTSSGMAAVFRLHEHLSRYRETCDYLQFESEHLDQETLYNAIMDLVRNSEDGNLYIRPIAFVGEGIMALEMHPQVHSAIFAAPLKTQDEAPVINLGISQHIRSTATISKKISRNYFDPYLGLKNKEKTQHDLIFLDKDGLITETSAHNVFLITNAGEVLTPRKTHCLAGITRASVITLLRDMGIVVSEEDIPLKNIGSFCAGFTTSTASEIRIIGRIGDQILNHEHPTIRQIVKSFRSCVLGKIDKYKDWNCYV